MRFPQYRSPSVLTPKPHAAFRDLDPRIRPPILNLAAALLAASPQLDPLLSPLPYSFNMAAWRLRVQLPVALHAASSPLALTSTSLSAREGSHSEHAHKRTHSNWPRAPKTPSARTKHFSSPMPGSQPLWAEPRHEAKWARPICTQHGSAPTSSPIPH